MAQQSIRRLSLMMQLLRLQSIFHLMTFAADAELLIYYKVQQMTADRWRCVSFGQNTIT
jgi:hypothetical protein